MTQDREETRADRQTLVIIGNGMVGWKLCQKLVEHGAHLALDIVVFGEEARMAYDRLHLTDLFSGRAAESLHLAPERWYAEHDIELHLGDPVVEIDRQACVLRSAKGVEVPYDRLVFATGSRPFVPPIPGVDLPGVFVYRTIEHIADIIEYSDGLSRAAVLGGGLLGLEAAKALRDLGLEVHVVEAAPGLMSRQLDPRGQELLKEKIERLGVKLHLGKAPTRIEGARPGRRAPNRPPRILHLGGGGRIKVNMVVVSAGIRPRGDLAAACGLDLADNGGIVVDDHLTTSDPRIFAIGECAAHRGTTYGLVLPGYQMVSVLVDNLAGGKASFKGGDRSAKLKLLDIAVASLGAFEERESMVYDQHGAYRKLTTRDGKLVGCIAVGEWENLDQVRDAIEQGRPISFWDNRRFKSTGMLFARSESPHVSAWPADAMVCGCMRVTRGALSQAQSDGCALVEELGARTGAGTMCGSCKPLLVELLGGAHSSLPASAPRSLRDPRGVDPDLPPKSLGARELAAALRAPPPLEIAPLSRRRASYSSPPSAPPSAPSTPVASLVPPQVSMRVLTASELGEERIEEGPLSQRSPSRAAPSRRSRLPAWPSAVDPPWETKALPSIAPSNPPSNPASIAPSAQPSIAPSNPPSIAASVAPSDRTSVAPSDRTSVAPSARTSVAPSIPPSIPSPKLLSPLPAIEAVEGAPSSLRAPIDAAAPELDAPPSVRSPLSVRPRASLLPLRPIVLPPAALAPEPGQAEALGRARGLAAERGHRLLFAASLAALAAVLVIALAVNVSGPLPPARTFQGIHLASLWTTGVGKQATGYTAAASGLASLVLSLRKRWKRFSYGELPALRILHACLGLVTLLALVLHTGLHLGIPRSLTLDRSLMINTLALAIFGGVAGGVFSRAHRFESAQSALRHKQRWSQVHLVLCWPIPVLLILHIIAAYYY